MVLNPLLLTFSVQHVWFPVQSIRPYRIILYLWRLPTSCLVSEATWYDALAEENDPWSDTVQQHVENIKATAHQAIKEFKSEMGF